MTSEQAFLDAIVAHPDDDTPRLIMADWLEDQGQKERAEFIRVQCELASRGKDAAKHFWRVQMTRTSAQRFPPSANMPTDCSCDDCRLRRRQSELLVGPDGECCRCDWHAPMRHYGEPNGAWEYHRGFIERIETTCQQWLDHGADILRACPTVREVRFSDVEPRALEMTTFSDGANRKYKWICHPPEFPENRRWPSSFDAALMQSFDSEAAAHEALSHCAIAFARNQLAKSQAVTA